MKRFLLMAISLLVFQTAIFPVEAAEDSLYPLSSEKNKSLTWGKSSNNIDISFGYLISQSHCGWEVSFPDQYGRGKSELKFTGMSSSIPFVSLDIKYPNSYASLSIQFGKGLSSNGEGTDTDYQAGATYLRSKFDLTEETTLWISDIQTTFTFHSKPRWVLKPFLGWQHYEEKIKMTNGFWTNLNGAETNTPIDGLGSRYDFSWDALRMGIRGELELVSPRQSGIIPLRLKSHLAVFPFIHYRGVGVWNLRDDFRQDPSFYHEADNFGLLGMDGTISLVYQPLKHLEFEGGGRILYFNVQDGTDMTYFSNNTDAKVTLNEAQAIRIGLFLQITGRF
ncbi:MAG: hypothetical protein MUQ20_04750 [Deltaproteobacteria bacterium]|nr:hypothetical protein [Deltaproteobacteria bacterium]